MEFMTLFCPTLEPGKYLINWLNKYYSIQEGHPEGGLTYDWCGCGKKNTETLPMLAKEDDPEPLARKILSLFKRK